MTGTAKVATRDKKKALADVAALERRLGAPLARWAMRKHLAVAGKRQATQRKIRALRAEVAALSRVR